MFDQDELEAVLVGARFVEAFASEQLGQAARRALIKIDAVVPPTLRARGERSRVFAPVTPRWARERALMGELHGACMSRTVVQLDYAREDGARGVRDVEPLCLVFWGQAWTLGAWCRKRGNFRNFRIDRIHALRLTGETLPERSERDLDAYLRAVRDASSS
jgi:predicted DNA-binding transcriptional regulator YafY